MLSVKKALYAECHYTERHNAECCDTFTTQHHVIQHIDTQGDAIGHNDIKPNNK